MINTYKKLIQEWVIIYRMIKVEDVSLKHLRRLCIEYNTDINRCYQLYLTINKISYQGAKKIAIGYIEKYITLLDLEEQLYANHLSSYELNAGYILSVLKNN